ncbi:MAG: CDP-diacylglycerol--glycerol-3-phosphate 3-phosphatidyltransferase [Gemmataceae bacterium]
MSAPTTAKTSQEVPLFNLANQLTASRFVMAVGLFVCIGFEIWWACVGLFGLAAFTDWLDGCIARMYDLSTPLGRVLDPLADKVIVCGALVFLVAVQNSGIEAWMVALVISREFMITGLRQFMEEQGLAFGAGLLGKIKMVLQCVVLLVVFVTLEYFEEMQAQINWVLHVRTSLIYAMVLVAGVSGLQYFWQAAKAIQQRTTADANEG